MKVSGHLDASFSRRNLFAGGAGLLCLVALGAAGEASYASEESDAMLRPPGAQDLERFFASCIRCGRCVEACPTDCISVANAGDGFFQARLPKLDFHLGYCDFCGGAPKCAAACPTNAIGSFDELYDDIGVAVINRDECVAFGNTGGCEKCIDICPYDAVKLADNGRTPEVDASKCNGCGMCEYFCPSSSLKRFGGGDDRGIAVMSLT